MSMNKGFKKVYLEPENRIFSEMMSNGKQYTIPRFQRDYAWQETQWDELWLDIEAMLANRTQHFMGYLVFKVGDGKLFEVIDGQQRLTTVLLILLAGLRRLQTLIDQGQDQQDNQRRIALYKERYFTVFDAVTLRPSAKITLNRHNKAHFIDLCKQHNVIQQRHITKTNRKINQAFQFFEKKFQAYPSGDAIAAVMNDVTDGLLFTTVTVQDDLDAYTVFATLNARGLHLSTPDLLKNYLLAKFAHDDQYTDYHFDEFDQKWSDILDQLGEKEFTAFLRSHIGMSDKIPKNLELYRTLINKYNQPDEILDYLDSLKQYAAVYAALHNPDDEFWHELDGKYHLVKPTLRIFKLFNIRTPLSLLMVGYTTLCADDFLKLATYIATLTIRYNVICGKPAKDQERLYNQMANKLMRNEATLYDLKKDLLGIYPNDPEFCLAFSEKCMPSRQSSKKIVFLLRKIESYISKEEPSENVTLEHVLPFHPTDQWQGYFGYENCANAIDRLGNMALLTKTNNMSQEPFSDKVKVLQTSPYQINQHIADYAEWNIEAVNDHQSWLAKQAKTVWRID